MDTQAWIDQENAHMAAMVRRHGWFIQYVGGDRCARPGCDCNDLESGNTPFAYTVGMFGLAHPELLIFGVTPDEAVMILNDLGNRVRAGENLLPGCPVTVDRWPRRIIPEVVPNPGQIALAANYFYRRPEEYSVPVLQLSVDDDAGRFPWENGYAGPEQPRPGSFQA